MKKILLFLVLPLFVFGAVDVSQIAKIQNDSFDIKEKQVVNYDSNNSDLNQTQFSAIKVFGAHLFSGNFTKFTQHVYNPDYKLTVGDRINVKIWGAVEFIQTLTVDSQGNIFIPKVGAINLLGVKNSALVSVITKAINKIYKSNVYVYADMDIYQNVSVFVTGNVNQPGLYQGLSSDSIIQYIDKAKGINLEYGSFREIEILRDNQVIKKIDLYDFLLKGELGLFPFRMGDVILVGSVKDYVFVNGDVQKPFRFELSQDIKTLADIANIAGAKPIVTNAVVKSYRADHRLQIDAYAKKDFSEVVLHAGDEIEFRPDYTAQNINIQIEGEHNGLHSIVVKKGTTLADVVDMISANPQSNMQALQIFRKSVAATQKQLINAQLKELETLALTSSSVNAEQASIRATQAKTILDFIERAKKVEPKGQIVIDSVKAYKAVVLEDGDIINIPSKNNIVLVQGEVSIPGAFVYINKEKLRYYINLAGGYSDRADVSRVLIINANGKATKYNGRSSADIKPGDSVLVLPKVDSQNLQVVSMLTQILYQIAIATNVVLNL
ncbi:polysaccharide biosynthesis/export family protein [Campylobacter insulaenigrae]|uniref:polysaccharide biosynthesis/export family protein n=1 Tax=Campylobacter insulaenigrae TaxID=260714 RepID=UPI002153687E|nr:polysaccharide biosynthesis/export family protein [Campylobacter insulaenigrae]MCR6571338.1 polysaccharide biosynthesis/export family protein [Campylobacter insulaenigrae]MCR6574039.1 polysaccharide biosynthesis/export family protein [Campylobacter insulaenigrae]MCR6578798.1 polysaccharide biosynthesis/export family protein [Campylobacter insulaenigrae]MCR6580337.1 polysaccharide biosynthesis/export family protein [Campylobacter insulaenigrae]MCR6583709.1 polysaccharide biosynthesis/export 